MSESDRRRFDPLIMQFMTGTYQEHQFAKDGGIAAPVWNFRLKGMRWLLEQPGMRHWWSDWGEALFDDDFVELVEGLIREAETAE
jgi:hypothetical protein